MNITLLRPPSLLTAGQISLSLTPPLGMAYVAASLLKAGHKVQAIDGVGENVFQFVPYGGSFQLYGLGLREIVDRIDISSALIGVSAMFSHEWPHTRQLITMVRQRFPHTPIIIGGEHATALSRFILETTPEVDYCALGEGEDVAADLAHALERGDPPDRVAGLAYRQAGTIHTNGLRPRLRQVDDIPLPAWHLFPLHNYLDNGLCSGAFRGRSMPITFTRGCPYECTFCSNPQMWTQLWKYRAPAKVVEEIQWLVQAYGAENFECCDLTAIVRKDWIVQFATLLINKNLNIAWQFPSGTRSEAIDAEVCDLLYRSGCRNLAYAPESGSPKVLKEVKKKVHLDGMIRSMRSAVKRGINVRVNLVLGFPDDTHRDVFATLKFIARLAWYGAHDITHFTFTPYPGSELFERLRAAGRIPQLDDRYFFDLLAMTDLRKTVSYAERISARQLSFYRIFSLLWFYGLMFFLRPWRLIAIARNIFRQKQESRMEMALRNVLFRKKSSTSTFQR